MHTLGAENNLSPNQRAFGSNPAIPGLKFAVVLAIAFIAAALWLFLGSNQHYRLKWVRIADVAFQGRFAAITEGTNHVVFSNSSALASTLQKPPANWFARWFPKRLRALSQGLASIKTPSNSTVFWLGWTSQVAQPLCKLSDSGGRTVTLPFLSGPWGSPSAMKGGSLFVQPFELPSNSAGLHGSTLHVYLLGSGVENDVATV